MADTDNAEPQVKTAAQLRAELLEAEIKKMDEEKAEREAAHKAHAAFAEKFLHEDITEEERALIRRLVEKAVQDGKFQTMIYSFPSTLCTDRGRAINNALPDWPETLQGKAKQIYDRFEEVARPAGYKLTATIINFPNDVPGDVGFFLSWSEF